MTGKRVVRSYTLTPPNTDGRLIVVSRDLKRAVAADGIACGRYWWARLGSGR